MTTLDLTLAALRLAGLTNFTPEFGTKEADGVSVSTENVCKDIMMPFTFQRPVLVNETSDTSNIEANRTLVLTNSNIILTLGRATFAGCKIVVQAGFTSGSAEVKYLTAANIYETVTLAAGNSVEIISNSALYFYNRLRVNNSISTNSNLVTVLGAANAADAFAALRTRADAGNFYGLRLGDYIDVPSMTIDGSVISNSNQRLRFEIAGFDTYLNVGDTPVSSHHILMISKNCVLQKAMNSTATNAGGYIASDLCAYLNNQVKTGLVNAIGITPKTVYRLLDNKNEWAWLAETVFIPTEVEVFGHQAWSNNKGYSTGSSVQWPLFSEFPQKRIATWNGSRWWWWEASPRTDNSAYFCSCGSYGIADCISADYSPHGVRFAFLV